MSGPETKFIEKIHKALPPEIHREKMHNPYRGGTFDCWYSGKHGDMWIEYKWVNKMSAKKVKPNLSKLQLLWGKGRMDEGRNVAVVVGSPQGTAVCLAPDLWEEGIPVRSLLTVADVVSFIVLTTTGREYVPDKKAVKSSKRNNIDIQDSNNRSTDLGVVKNSAKKKEKRRV